MVEYLSGNRIQCTELEETNDSGNATLNGTSTNSATAINGVGSIDFDGTASDYIEFSQTLTDKLNTATGSGSWTFSCWVYVENTSTDQHTILSKIVAGYSSPNHELNFRQAGSNWQLHFGTSFSGTNTQAIGHTGWTHLILSATNLGTTAVVWKLYVDNQASPVTVTGTEAMLWNTSTALLFGRQNRSGSDSERWFDGQAQEIAFWNKELDSSERSALFNSYAYGTATSSSNTGAKANTVATSSNLAYYTLNSSSVTNSSPNPSLGSNHPVNTRLEVTDTRKIYRRAILKDNCIAYYNFDSTTGGLVNQATTTNGFTDGLGSAVDGTVSGATLDTTNEKLGTGCYDFDGTDDYVNLGTNSGLNILNGGTVAMWINYDSMTDKRWAGKGSNGAWEILSEGGSGTGKIKFRVKDSGSPENAISTTVLSSSTWYHVAGVYDKSAGKIKIYINGALEATTSSIGQIATVSTATYFGRHEGNNNVDGRIDDAGIWNIALSDAQISALYNSGTGKLINEAGVWKERGSA